jgi:hypothetical protein
MTEKPQPPPKDFKVFIAYDEDVSKFYVAETEFAGLIIEDADAGRLISRLFDAAADLLEVTAEKGRNKFGQSLRQIARLVSVFCAAAALDLLEKSPTKFAQVAGDGCSPWAGDQNSPNDAQRAHLIVASQPTTAPIGFQV